MVKDLDFGRATTHKTNTAKTSYNVYFATLHVCSGDDYSYLSARGVLCDYGTDRYYFVYKFNYIRGYSPVLGPWLFSQNSHYKPCYSYSV